MSCLVFSFLVLSFLVRILANSLVLCILVNSLVLSEYWPTPLVLNGETKQQRQQQKHLKFIRSIVVQSLNSIKVLCEVGQLLCLFFVLSHQSNLILEQGRSLDKHQHQSSEQQISLKAAFRSQIFTGQQSCLVWILANSLALSGYWPTVLSCLDTGQQPLC